MQLCDSHTVGGQREHHLLSAYYALSTELDPFLILSLIPTVILGVMLHCAHFTEEETEVWREEEVVLSPTAGLGSRAGLPTLA